MPGLIMAVGTPWKRALYLGFLFLLATLKERIVADPPSSPTSVLQVEEGGAADTEKQSHSLACVPWPALWACLPSCEDKCVCVRVLRYKCVCVQTRIRGGSVVTVGNLFASCSTSSPSLTVTESKIVRAISSHSFSMWWHRNYRRGCG